MSKPSDQINPSDVDRYSVIPRVLIFLFEGERVLLIKGSPSKKLWPGMYNGLGGHVEKGEDPLRTARRELLEESGLSCTNLQLCGTVMVDPGGIPGIAIFIYRGDYDGGDVIGSCEGNLEWVRLNDISQYPVVKDLLTILPVIGNWRPGNPVISALYRYDAEDELEVEINDSSVGGLCS